MLGSHDTSMWDFIIRTCKKLWPCQSTLFRVLRKPSPLWRAERKHPSAVPSRKAPAPAKRSTQPMKDHQSPLCRVSWGLHRLLCGFGGVASNVAATKPCILLRALRRDPKQTRVQRRTPGLTPIKEGAPTAHTPHTQIRMFIYTHK